MQNRQWARLLWSPLLHADDLHLLYNVSSFLYKGSQLEPALRTLPFAALLTELALVSQALYVALAATGLAVGPRMNSCAVGFSGVLFGLKVVLTHNAPGWSSVLGVALPTKVLDYLCDGIWLSYDVVAATLTGRAVIMIHTIRQTTE
jgi:rhomboid domain-containing protein 1